MAIPFLILGAAGVTALTGIGKGVGAIRKNKKAKSINAEAQSVVRSAKTSATRAKNRSAKALETLGKTKLDVLNGSMKEFVNTFEKIHSITFTDSKELSEFGQYHMDKQQLADLKEMGNLASSVLGGVVGGAGVGALTAFGAYGATMTFASASTGTAIASLSGAAASNATLAFLGGGSLAAGGMGMVGGTMVLGGVVAGPALCVLGLVMNASARKNLDNAYANLAEAKKLAESLHVVATLCKGVKQRADMFTSLLNCLNSEFAVLIEKMKRITVAQGFDYQKYTEEEQKNIVAAMALAKAIKQVLDTPILTESGAVTETSQQVYDTVSKQYGNQIPETTARTKKSGSINYKRALTAALNFFAQCDGNVSIKEQAILNQYISTINESKDLTQADREELNKIAKTNYNSFEEIVEYLDLVTEDRKSVV